MFHSPVVDQYVTIIIVIMHALLQNDFDQMLTFNCHHFVQEVNEIGI